MSPKVNFTDVVAQHSIKLSSYDTHWHIDIWKHCHLTNYLSANNETMFGESGFYLYQGVGTCLNGKTTYDIHNKYKVHVVTKRNIYIRDIYPATIVSCLHPYY